MDLITFIRERRLKELVAEEATTLADGSNGVYKAVPRIPLVHTGTPIEAIRRLLERTTMILCRCLTLSR